MPTNRFCRVYLPSVVDLAQPQHIIFAKPPAAAQEVMYFAGTVYPLATANNAANSAYSALKAFLLFIHTYSWGQVS